MEVFPLIFFNPCCVPLNQYETHREGFFLVGAAVVDSKMSEPEISIRHVTVLGGGQSGSQIAAQCAAFGVHVSLYDLSADRLQAAKKVTTATLRDMAAAGIIDPGRVPAVNQRVRFMLRAEEAADGCQLLIETVTEDLKIKRDVLRQFDALCPADAIFTTNTSFLSPSSMAHASGRPALFAGFHFHTPVWGANVVDVMPHRLTAPETIDRLTEFGRKIGQNAVRLNKESNGYLYNRMSLPMLLQSLQMAAENVATVEDIDRAWMGVTKMAMGPLGMLDNIGLDTVHKIATYWAAMIGDKSMVAGAEYLAGKIARGELGVKAGKGFYDYPQPAFTRPGFVLDIGGAGGGAASGFQRLILEQPAVSSDSQLPESLPANAKYAVIGAGAAANALVERIKNAGRQSQGFPETGAEIREWIRATHSAGISSQVFYLLETDGESEVADVCDRVTSLYELANDWLSSVPQDLAEDAGFSAAPAHSGPTDDSAAIAVGAAFALNSSLNPAAAGHAPPGRTVVTDVNGAGEGPGERASLQGNWLVYTGGGRVELAFARHLSMLAGVHVHVVAPWKLPADGFETASVEEISRLKQQVMKDAYQARRKPNVAWEEYWQRLQCRRMLTQTWASGGGITFHTCDFDGKEATAGLLEVLRAGDGIKGVIWGTGAMPRMGMKHTSGSEVSDGLRTYVGSLLNVLRMLEDEPPGYLWTIGRAGPAGGAPGSPVEKLVESARMRLIHWFKSQHPATSCRYIRVPAVAAGESGSSPDDPRDAHAFLQKIVVEELAATETSIAVEWRRAEESTE